MIYLSLDDVLYLRELQIRQFDGSAGARDLGLIEASLLRPQTGYYKDVIEEAAALWESLTMNHGFVDGNKRIGLVAADVFLELNGYRIQAEPDDIIEFIQTSLSDGTFEKDRLDGWLRAHVVKTPD